MPEDPNNYYITLKIQRTPGDRLDTPEGRAALERLLNETVMDFLFKDSEEKFFAAVLQSQK